MKSTTRWPRAHTRAFMVMTVCTVLILGSTAAGSGPARAAVAPARAGAAAGRPLADLLNPDGTVNLHTGFSGSLDTAGWRLTGALQGAPRFAPLAPGDENWDAGLWARRASTARSTPSR